MSCVSAADAPDAGAADAPDAGAADRYPLTMIPSDSGRNRQPSCLTPKVCGEEIWPFLADASTSGIYPTDRDVLLVRWPHSRGLPPASTALAGTGAIEWSFVTFSVNVTDYRDNPHPPWDIDLQRYYHDEAKQEAKRNVTVQHCLKA